MPSAVKRIGQGLAFFFGYESDLAQQQQKNASCSSSSPSSSSTASAASSTDQLPVYTLELTEGERALSPAEQEKILRRLERQERKRQEALFVEHKLEQAMKSYGW